MCISTRRLLSTFFSISTSVKHCTILTMLADQVNLPTVKPMAGDQTSASTSPINTHQLAVTIDGVHTDIVYQMFSDKLFIIATQLGKMGTMISCEADGIGGGAAGGGGGKQDSMEVNTRVILGDPDQPLLVVFASNLFKKLSPYIDRRTLLISVALKDKTMRILQALEKVIMENRIS